MVRATQPAPEASVTGQRLLREMLARIQDGRWPIGSALPGERPLMAEFGVSRVAMREALAALRALGVLEIAHGRRSRVRPVGADVLSWLLPLVLAQAEGNHARQMLDVRLALEPQMAALAARERSEEHLERLHAAAETTQAHAANGGRAFLAGDLAFHRILSEACGNPLLAAIVESLARFYERFVAENADASPEQRRQAARDHLLVVDAIRIRDADVARARMQAHLLGTASPRARQ
jgi:GntR family transcriptional regulator, transcriptional repressor for pyruvate dehydrogenase complex